MALFLRGRTTIIIKLNQIGTLTETSRSSSATGHYAGPAAPVWGLGMGVHESIIPAAVAPMVSPSRRASAYGLFTGGYGIAWFAGSATIGALLGVSFGVVIAFALVVELAAIPLILLVARHGSSHSA